MKYYKSENGDVFAFESDDSQDKYISPDLISMTLDEVQAHLSPQSSSEEMASAARTKRDALIAATDWIVLRAQETGAAVPGEWMTYRQALRDVPEQSGFPQSIEWPTAPLAV